MEALLTNHVQDFVKKHLEPLAMPMPNHSAFLTQFREEMPFAKPVVGGSSNSNTTTPTPLINHNHMYKASNAKIVQEFFNVSKRTTTTTTTSNPNHRKTNVWDELDFIAFNEGYNRTCELSLELEHIWTTLFGLMKVDQALDDDAAADDSTLFKALTTLYCNGNANHTHQTKLALCLVHIHRAKALESQRASQPQELKAYRARLARLLHQHFEDLFEHMVYENAIFNAISLRALRKFTVYTLELSTSVAWIFPRFLCFLWAGHYAPHTLLLPARIHQHQAITLSAVTGAQWWLMSMRDKPAYQRIRSLLFAGFLALDGLHSTGVLPETSFYWMQRYPAPAISIGLLLIAAHFYAVFFTIRCGPRLWGPIGVDLMLMSFIAFNAVEEFRFRALEPPLLDPQQYAVSNEPDRGYVSGMYNLAAQALNAAAFMPSSHSTHMRKVVAQHITKAQDTTVHLQLWAEFLYANTLMQASHPNYYRTRNIKDDFIRFQNYRTRRLEVLHTLNTSTTSSSDLNDAEDTENLFVRLTPLWQHLQRLVAPRREASEPPLCIIVDTAPNVEAIRKFDRAIFAEMYTYVNETMWREEAPQVKQWLKSLSPKVLEALRDAKTHGCEATFTMPDPEYWSEGIDQQQHPPYSIDLNTTGLLLALNTTRQRVALNNSLLSFVAHTPRLHPSFQLQPFEADSQRFVLNDLPKWLRSHLFPTILLEDSRHMPRHLNPYYTLGTWLELVDNETAPLIRPADRVHFQQVFALASLSDTRWPLLSVLHNALARNALPITYSPLWLFRTVFWRDRALWKWTEDTLGAPLTIGELPAKAQSTSLADMQQLHLRQQNEWQIHYVNTAQARHLLMQPAQMMRGGWGGWHIAQPRAMFLACMGILPRPIPPNLTPNADETLTLVEKSPSVYTMQLMLLLSKRIVAAAHLDGHRVNEYGDDEAPPAYLSLEAYMDDIEEELKTWLAWAHKTLRMTKTDLENHLRLIFYHLHLYATFEPYAMDRQRDPYIDHIARKMTSVWDQMDPALEVLLSELPTRVDFANQAVLETVAAHSRTEFQRMVSMLETILQKPAGTP
jgi:hypothetical protein